MNGLGIDKMLDLKNLSSHLSSISKEDYTAATSNIINLLGLNKDKDNVIAKCITEMMSSLQEDMATADFSKSDDPIAQLMKLAENTANKVMPTIDKDRMKADAENLIANTGNMAENFNNNVLPQMKDKEGNPLNSGPLNMLMGLLKNLPKPK